jgi:hypothetical protein
MRAIFRKHSLSIASSAGNHHHHQFDEELSTTSSSKSDYGNSKERIQSLLIDFWYNDMYLPPFYGMLRFVYYMCYWLSIVYARQWFIFKSNNTYITFHEESCYNHLESLQHYANLDFPYKVESGLFGYLLSTIVNYNKQNDGDTQDDFDLSDHWFFNCHWLSWGFHGGLVLSAIGLGWKLPRIACAISFWLMFSIKSAKFTGQTSHGQYVTGYALVALCFAEDNLIDVFSIDSLLVLCYQRFRQRRRTNSNENSNSGNNLTTRTPSSTTNRHPSTGGAAKKFILFVSVVSFFFAGLHKFASHGFAWMDGQTIYKCLLTERGRSKVLHDLFVDYPILSVPLAITSVVGEMASIAVMWQSWYRPYGILTFYMFHIGGMPPPPPPCAVMLSYGRSLKNCSFVFHSSNASSVCTDATEFRFQRNYIPFVI